MCEDLIGREVGKKSEICYTKQAVKYIERRREEDSKERHAKKSRKNTELKQNVCKDLILPRHSSVYVLNQSWEHSIRRKEPTTPMPLLKLVLSHDWMNNKCTLIKISRLPKNQSTFFVAVQFAHD